MQQQQIKIIHRRISFYSQNTYKLPRKPMISYRNLKSGIEEFSWNVRPGSSR